MRGDSLRDLYAKALALAGLGVLAGAGVLVDYWPIGLTFPRVDSALRQSSVPPAADFVQPSLIASAEGTGHIAQARFVETRQPRAEPEVVRSAPAVPSLPATEPGSPLGVVLVLEPFMVTASAAPTAPVASDVAPSRFGAGFSSAATSDESVDVASSQPPSRIATLDATSQADPDGFVTDAVKKTGTSIVRTSRRTGASIVDAMRVVSGAVKKALPN